MTASASKNKSIGIDLLNQPIIKTLITFAVPIVLTNLIQQLYSMVDLMVIGKFVGSTGTVGVSTGGELADLVTPAAMGFSTAGQIYIAQLAGAKDETHLKRTVGTLLTFMFLISGILMVLAITFSRPFLIMINCPEEALSAAQSYMIITAIGFPFIFGYNAICGILRGLGEARRPLIFIIIAAVVNIFGDLLLVIVFHLDAAGTAIATILSQFGSFAAAMYFLLKHKEKFDFELKRSSLRLYKDELLIIVKLGIPQVVRSSLVRVSLLWINANINSYGLVVSATNSIGNKIQKFADIFYQGVSASAGAMIGQNLGAQKKERAAKTVWAAWLLASICAAVVAILCWTIPEKLVGIFTNDTAVIELCVVYLHIMTVHFFASAFVGSFQAMVTGSGFIVMDFMIGILDGVICKVGLSLLFVNVLNMGYVGYFWGVDTSRILPGILCFLYFMSGKWRYRKLLGKKSK